MKATGWIFGDIAALFAPAVIVWLAGSFITLDPSWLMTSTEHRIGLTLLTTIWGFFLLCMAGT